MNQGEVSEHREEIEAQKWDYFMLQSKENMQKVAGCVILTHPDFCDVYSLINLYTLD